MPLYENALEIPCDYNETPGAHYILDRASVANQGYKYFKKHFVKGFVVDIADDMVRLGDTPTAQLTAKLKETLIKIDALIFLFQCVEADIQGDSFFKSSINFLLSSNGPGIRKNNLSQSNNNNNDNYSPVSSSSSTFFSKSRSSTISTPKSEGLLLRALQQVRETESHREDEGPNIERRDSKHKLINLTYQLENYYNFHLKINLVADLVNLLGRHNIKKKISKLLNKNIAANEQGILEEASIACDKHGIPLAKDLSLTKDIVPLITSYYQIDHVDLRVLDSQDFVSGTPNMYQILTAYGNQYDHCNLTLDYHQPEIADDQLVSSVSLSNNND